MHRNIFIVYIFVKLQIEVIGQTSVKMSDNRFLGTFETIESFV